MHRFDQAIQTMFNAACIHWDVVFSSGFTSRTPWRPIWYGAGERVLVEVWSWFLPERANPCVQTWRKRLTNVTGLQHKTLIITCVCVSMCTYGCTYRHLFCRVYIDTYFVLAFDACARGCLLQMIGGHLLSFVFIFSLSCRRDELCSRKLTLEVLCSQFLKTVVMQHVHRSKTMHARQDFVTWWTTGHLSEIRAERD